MVVAESSGHLVYVLKENTAGTDLTKNFYLDTFQVDSSTPTLVPISSQLIDLVGTGSAVADPRGRGIAIFVDQRISGTLNANAVLYTIAFDTVTGLPVFDPSGGQILGLTARALAISPTGNYLALTYGVSGGTLISFTIGQNSFTLKNNGAYDLGPDRLPSGVYNVGGYITYNPGGQILYVQSAPDGFSGGGLPFQMFDPPTYLILPASPLSISDAMFFEALPDTQGPYAYSSQPAGGINVFYIDPVSGRASQTGSIGSPFYPQLGLLRPVLAPFGPTGGQGTSGPVLSLSFPALTFAQLTAGQSSAPQSIVLKNVGNEVVSLSSISLVGGNSTDFQLANNCNPPVLAANQSCTLSITYAPPAPGSSSASIVIASNTPQSPQTVLLSGTAVAPVSQVKFTPASVVFPATTEGTSSHPIVLTLTNTGGAPLHISATAIGGVNVPDFSFSQTNCVGTINAGATCTISVTFTPLAAGLRTANWTVTDDAAGSPRTVSITGTSGPAAQIAGTTTVTVSAGQPAQFNLQAVAGPDFSGTLTFSCSGIPFGATCNPPTSLRLDAGATAPFTVAVNTLGASLLSPPPPVPTSPLRLFLWLIALACVALAAFLLRIYRVAGAPRLSSAATIAATALTLCLIVSGMGCGGSPGAGNSTPPTSPNQQTVATPSIQPAGGTFTSPQTIFITDATPGSAIFYTTDGSAPTASATVYSAPFSLSSTATIKAMATASGYSNSAIAGSAFSFRSPAGSYSVTVNVTATPSATAKSLSLSPIVLTLNVN